jgi:hypothetical protein
MGSSGEETLINALAWVGLFSRNESAFCRSSEVSSDSVSSKQCEQEQSFFSGIFLDFDQMNWLAEILFPQAGQSVSYSDKIWGFSLSFPR